MKSLTVKSKPWALLATLAGCAAGLMSAQAANSSFVTFSVDMANAPFTVGTDTVSVNGTFNNWGAFPLVEVGNTTVYTNTVNDTANANGTTVSYKFVIDGNNWETLPTGQNRAALLPSTSGASLVLPTAFFADDGSPVDSDVTFQVDVSQQIALGNFIPGVSTVEARGLFNGWSGGASELTYDPTITVTNQYGLVTSNVWTGTFTITASPGGMEAFKYVINPGTEWESPSAANQDTGGNRYFANVAQTLPLVNFSDQPYAPLAQVTFSVDMSAVQLTDTNFNPTTVTLDGDFNGWGSPVPMTNNPTALNTNIYYAVISVGEGSPVNYQFRYNELSTGQTVYDHYQGGNANRYYQVPSSLTATVPTVYFNDAPLNGLLTQATPVQFSVDMNGAVGYGDNHVFDPTQDSVYVNGSFVGWYAWANGANPQPAPPGFQLFEVGLTTVYTNTLYIPAGTTLGFSYKYGMDPYSAQGGPSDDEAASGNNHYRVVRSTALVPYPFPTDTFGNMYVEPLFNANNRGGANLTVGPAVGGKVPVSWLGRPGANLQFITDLKSVDWRNLPATDGTHWTSGYSSTNGFVSVTNWPATTHVFFRLVNP